MNTPARKLLVTILLASAGIDSLSVMAQPAVFTYQGRLSDKGTNFTGNGQFRFALVTSTNSSRQATATANLSGQFVTSYNVTFGGSGYVSAPSVTVSGGGGSGATAHATISGGAVSGVVADNAGTGYTSAPSVTIAPPPANIVYTTYWSNDGTSTNGSEPTSPVSVVVNNGLLNVQLGDTTLSNMNPIDSSVFNQPNLQLRIWFNDGVNGSIALNPAQSLTPAPYAIRASSAISSSNLTGALPASQLSGPILNSQLANSSVTVNSGTGLSGGGLVALGGSITLNNAGVTSLNAGGGITVSGSSGSVTLGSTATSANVSNAIVSRDSSGDFSANNVNMGGNLNLADVTNKIYAGSETLIHNSGPANFFAGESAGNIGATGAYNTGVGRAALYHNTSGYQNTACGEETLGNNLTGGNNVAIGMAALDSVTNGSQNVAIGSFSLPLLRTGNGNIAIGASAGQNITTGSGNIDIGNSGFGDESNVIRIGTSQTKAVMVGIYGATIASGGTPVYVNSSGLLGTITSSARFKTNIEDMASASDCLLSLRPVAFTYKKEIDPDSTHQFGLIAEEVEKVNPDLVVRNSEGKPYSVRYEAVNAMLLNEFLKEHDKVKEQEARVRQLEQSVAELKSMFPQLTQSKAK